MQGTQTLRIFKQAGNAQDAQFAGIYLKRYCSLLTSSKIGAETEIKKEVSFEQAYKEENTLREKDSTRPLVTGREKAQYLSRYKQVDLRIQRKCEEMALWRQRALQITPVYSEIPGKDGSDRIQSAVDHICEIEEDINRDIDELVEIRQEIRRAICSVKDHTLETLLELRYIDGLTWEDLAEKMHYTYQWVCKLHGRALKRMEIPKTKNGKTVDSN